MVSFAEIAVDLWIFSLPTVAIVWALLRIFDDLRPRARYVLVVSGFVIALVLVFTPARTQPAWSGGPASLPAAHSWQTVAARAAAFPLAMVWVAGALVLLARDCAGHLRLRLGRRRWSPATEQLRDALQWPAAVPLYVCQGVLPLTAGLVRPVVVLPALLIESHPGAIASRIALHELSHARWRDPLVFAGMRLIAAALWIAPLWPLLRWARREREAAADAFALRDSAHDQDGYIAALLQLARGVHHAAAPMAGNDLEYRARRILGERPRRSFLIATVVLVMSAGFVWTAGHAELTYVEPARTTEPAVRTATVAAVQPPSRATLVRRVARPRQSLPASRFAGLSLEPASPPEEPLPHVDRRVDLSRHAHVTRAQPPPDDDRVIVIRHVIRTR